LLPSRSFVEASPSSALTKWKYISNLVGALGGIRTPDPQIRSLV
jgi:hypothetical protein